MNIDENIENNIIQYGQALIWIKKDENNNKRIMELSDKNISFYFSRNY